MKISKPRRAICATATCLHEPCHRDRAIVDARCVRCGEPIGFETEYLVTGGDEEFTQPIYKHAACDLPAGSIFA